MTLRSLARLVLAALTTLALAAAAAFGVQAVLWLLVSDALPPPPPVWVILAAQALPVAALLYRRFRMRKSAPPWS